LCGILVSPTRSGESQHAKATSIRAKPKHKDQMEFAGTVHLEVVAPRARAAIPDAVGLQECNGTRPGKQRGWCAMDNRIQARERQARERHVAEP